MDVLRVVPATLDEAELRDELGRLGASAIIKVGRHFGKVRQVLVDLGLVERAVIVEGATQGGQRVSRMDALGDAARPYFSTILISADVATFGESV